MSSSSRSLRGTVSAPLAGAAAMLCAGAWVTQTACAANAWVFDPRVEAGAVYDDNYRLTSQRGQEIEVTGAGLDAAFGMRSEGQRSLLELTPRVHSTFFPNAHSEESTDWFLHALAEKRTRRLVSTFQATFADETVVSSDLPAANFPGIGLGQPVSGDTGRVSLQNRRRLIIASPSLTYDWTERRHLTFDLQYSDATYQNRFFEQIGYRDYGGGAGIRWDVSQRHSFALRAVADRFSPADASQDTTNSGVNAEWRTATSAVTSYYLRVGMNHSDRNATGTDTGISANSFNGGIGAAWQWQVTRLVIDALRTTLPSGSGVVEDRDELRFRVTRVFQPRFSGFLAMRGIRTTGLQNNATSVRERKYATGSTGFEWRANRQFSIQGAYDYAWQKYQGDLTAAVSNGVNLSLVYEPRRLKN
jgi:hypothetical protein